MKPEYLDRLNVWCEEEMASLRVKGATEQDFKEPVLANAILKTILGKHSDKIRSNKEFAMAIFLVFFKNLSPSEVRKMAAKDRADGNLEIAYNLELIADHRERGDFGADR
jgi:hypothetical protein